MTGVCVYYIGCLGEPDHSLWSGAYQLDHFLLGGAYYNLINRHRLKVTGLVYETVA